MSAARLGSHMRSEILQQPDRWLDLLAMSAEPLRQAADLIRDLRPELIVFVARGSSGHAALYGQYLAQNVLSIPATLATPSTVTAFSSSLRYPRSAVVALSQSGESPDLIDTVRMIQADNHPVIGITNNPESTLARVCDMHVPLSAGLERSVAATKTYTAELLALNLLFFFVSEMSRERLEAMVCDAANAARQLLAQAAEPVAAMAERLAERNRYMLIGRGYSMASAKEGALKLMETASLPASGWSAAEAIHGPLGQVVPGTVVIPLTASPGGRASVLDFAAAARDRGGTIVEVGTGASNPEPLAATWPLRFQALGAVPEQMVPLLEVIPLQMLALELSIRAGKDPDNPPGLKKVSRTV